MSNTVILGGSGLAGVLLLSCGMGVHYFRCNSGTPGYAYPKGSPLAYYCPAVPYLPRLTTALDTFPDTASLGGVSRPNDRDPPRGSNANDNPISPPISSFRPNSGSNNNQQLNGNQGSSGNNGNNDNSRGGSDPPVFMIDRRPKDQPVPDLNFETQPDNFPESPPSQKEPTRRPTNKPSPSKRPKPRPKPVKDPGKFTFPKEIFRLSGKHDIYKEWITLSGFSSGGTFAQQLQFSYSSLFSGIATFSHAYYRCGPADGLETSYDDACTTIGQNETYNPARAAVDIKTYESLGLIDDTRNLINKRLYIYAPMRSSLFSLQQSLGALKIYEPLIKNPLAIRTRVQDAEQLYPTKGFGAPCTQPAEDSFFIGDCGFSGAYESLNFLLEPRVALRKPTPGTQFNPSRLLPFDQTEFFYGFAGVHFMDAIGYAYIPRHCYRRKCFLHFYFHGCLTGREFNGTNHIMNTGLLELAEVNDLIVIFPQAVGTGVSPPNEIGCWDTYGISDRIRSDGRILYATKRGPQVTVVRNMLSRLLGAHNSFLNYVEANNNYLQYQGSKNKPIEFEVTKSEEVFSESSSSSLTPTLRGIGSSTYGYGASKRSAKYDTIITSSGTSSSLS